MSSDPNKQGQYPPPQWDNAPQRGAPYPAQPPYPPQHPNSYRVSIITLSTRWPILLTNRSCRVLLHRVTEALPRHQERWSLYLHLHTNIPTRGCTHRTTCMASIHLTHADLHRPICNTRPSQLRGSGPLLRVVTADGARCVRQTMGTIYDADADYDPDSLLRVRSLR